jgi:hypothetical protein
MTGVKFNSSLEGKKRRTTSPLLTASLGYIRSDELLPDADLRLHLLFPHEGWARESDRTRVAFLRAYLDYLADPRVPATDDIITLPAGFHREGTASAVRQTMESALAAYRNRTILLSAGIDTPDGREYSYLLDLSGPSIAWPVFVEKFNRDEPRGDREDRRSCLWHGAEVFSLCCMDATSVRGGSPPDSLRWSGDASFHVVLDNTHYHGRPGQSLWTVSNAGAISAGLGRLVKLRGRITGGRPGVAAMAFYTSHSPFGSPWCYPTLGLQQRPPVNFSTGTGPAAVWHRIIPLTSGRRGNAPL